MVLDTVARFRQAFYRLVGTTSSDTALTENSESSDDVAYLCLTHGCWNAQLFLVDNGLAGWWRTRSSALSFTGTDASAGGTKATLPTDFLRASGDENRSCLVEPNGDRWGTQLDEKDDDAKGDGFYFKGDELWLLRTASVPSTLYLDYIAAHAEFSAALASFDFPKPVRPLIPALAAEYAMHEAWFPLDATQRVAIKSSADYWRAQGKKFARQTRAPNRGRPKPMIGSRYIV